MQNKPSAKLLKTNILLVASALFLFACAAKKPEKRSTFMKGFSTYYNTLFNAKEALETEVSDRKKGFKDNFYAPYITILTDEDLPVGTEIGQTETFTDNQAPGSRNSTETPQNQGATTLEIAEAKALKAIDKYSVPRKGQEKNKEIFNAYIILAQSRLYMNKPLAALDALNYLFTNMKEDKRLPLAKIYQGYAYAKMKDYYKANDVFAKLNTPDLKKDYQKILSIYYAESLLQSGQKEQAEKELQHALAVNNNRKIKSRISFLHGQVLSSLGRNEQARVSFANAYKYANDFEFEVKSQIEIAKTFNGKGDYEGAKKYIEDISKKGTYASRKNEFYYALGLMADRAGKTAEAKEYYQKSLKEKISDPQIRGLSYYELGKGYFATNDYIEAGAYYDSALAVMTYEPSKILLKEQSANIKDIAKNYYLIKKNDSILRIAAMPAADREAYFSRYIADLKSKEAAIEKEKRQAENAKGFDTGDYSANTTTGSGFQDFSSSTAKGFYFNNQNALARGNADFRQVWGDRALADDWRYTSKMQGIQDEKALALGTTTANPRRFETSFYTEKIPTDPTALQSLKKDRDTASLGLGRMYDNYFGNRELATKTLYDLVDAKPEETVEQQALYQIFAMNYEKNPAIAERAKRILIDKYPYTSYAEFARNPKGGNFLKSQPEVENGYATAFKLYENEQFAESANLINSLVSKYPKDALVPKLSLLNAFNTGKTTGKEVMILQLEQIALNYPKTAEGEKAKEMLKYLKSEIGVEMSDGKGEKLVAPEDINGRADTTPPEPLKQLPPEDVKKMQQRENQKINANPLKKGKVEEIKMEK